MIADIRTMLWKEWKELLTQGGRGRWGKASLAFSVIPGVLFPLQNGRLWVDTPVALFTLGFAPLLVITIVADSVAGERERHTLETLLASRLPDRAILLGKIGAAVSFAWAQTAVFLLLGLLTVNLVVGRGDLLLYPLPVWLGVLALTPTLSALVAGIGALVSLRARTVRQAQLIVSSLFFLPIVALIALPFAVAFLSRFFGREALRDVVDLLRDAGLPALVLGASLLLLLADIVVITIAMARFHRARLMLD